MQNAPGLLAKRKTNGEYSANGLNRVNDDLKEKRRM